MDRRLATAPTVADMNAHAALAGVTETLEVGQQEPVAASNRQDWLVAVRIAVLDHARRQLELVESHWDRLDDGAVIHDAMSVEEAIATLPQNELVRKLGRQLAQQGLNATQVFDEINRRREPGQQYKLVLTLELPLRASVFARPEAPPLDAATDGFIREYLFAAIDAGGKSVGDTVVATDIADARSQLARMGYRELRMLSAHMVPFNRYGNWTEGMEARMVARWNESVSTRVLKVLRNACFILVPGLIVQAFERDAGGTPYVGATLLAIALAYALYAPLPQILHAQIEAARARGQFASALRYLALLQASGPNVEALALGLRCERAMLIAGAGRLDEALALHAANAALLDPISRYASLRAIYGSAGDHEREIEAARGLLAASDGHPEASIDLAWLLVRHTRQYDEARRLAAQIDPSHCADFAASALRIVGGLLDQADGRHEQAIAVLRGEMAFLARDHAPQLARLDAELRAFIALSMKALGQSEADVIWREVLPVLQAHHKVLLIERYESAA